MTAPSQRVLSVLGQRIGIFRVRELREATELSDDQVQGALRTLTQRGYAERRGEGCVKATAEGLRFLAAAKTIKSGPKGPRIMETEGTSLRSRLWRAINIVKKATVAELLELACRGTEANAEDNAKTYFNVLCRSGHLMRMNRRGPTEHPITIGATRYCLVLNTGPLAPQWNRRQKRVFDPNTGQVFDVA